MNTEMQSIWFYSTPKEFRESIYFKILIDNNIEVGINENSFTEMLIRIYENYITILEDGEIGGMYLVDNEIFMDVFNYISCQNTLIAYSKDKIDYLTNRLPKTQTTTQPTPPQKEIKPIQLNLEQRQIIYLFQNLIKEQMLNETNNPNLWHLVSQYFTDKDGNPLNNIHQNKDGLQNSKTGKPKKLANEIQTIVTNTKNSLE